MYVGNVPELTGGYSEFIHAAPDDVTYFRSIILFGPNTASYKFAFGRALLDLAQLGRSSVTLPELAPLRVHHILMHLKGGQAQSTMTDGLFLKAGIAHLNGQLDADSLDDLTAKHAFRYVLDLFHRLPKGESSVKFYLRSKQGKRTLTLTDELLRLTELERQQLAEEIEARWNLVEHAWTQQHLGLPGSRPIVVDHDSQDLVLLPWRNQSRKSLTHLRPALSGYQKSCCFYYFQPMDTTSGQSCHIDHFFPWIVGFQIPQADLNRVWNLVLACPSCNAGESGKWDAIPVRRFLERLHRRNTYLIDSHHPLRDTLIQDTGNTEAQRWQFLTELESHALTYRSRRWVGPPELEAVF